MFKLYQVIWDLKYIFNNNGLRFGQELAIIINVWLFLQKCGKVLTECGHFFDQPFSLRTIANDWLDSFPFKYTGQVSHSGWDNPGVQQEMMSLTYSGSRVYSKQLQIGSMALSLEQSLSKQENWFEYQSTVKHKKCVLIFKCKIQIHF